MLLPLALVFAFFAFNANAQTCHVPNLIRCLDSACVAGITGDNAIRCALCGDARAETTRQIRSIPAGATTLNPADGPNSPHARFAWAGTECLRLLPGCTPRDIVQNYYSLIENSCRGVADNLSRANRTGPVRMSDAECENNLTSCIDERCGNNWSGCEEQSQFDNHWSVCLVNSRCDTATNTAAFRTSINDVRLLFFNTFDEAIARAIRNSDADNAERINSVRTGCAQGVIMDQCIGAQCLNMPNRCNGHDRESERNIARNMCAFVDIACRSVR